MNIEKEQITVVNRPATTTTAKISHKTTTIKKSTTTTTIKKQDMSASISSFSMNYADRQAKFKVKVTNTGKLNFDDEVKFELHVLRQSGSVIEDMELVPVYAETKVFRGYLDGLEPRKSEDFEFIYDPEFYGWHEYFAEILHGNMTLDKTKAYYFEHKKLSP